MSEKLYLQWKDFKENVNSAFRKLRGRKEFTDITFVCEDGQQVEAHKVILVSSSPFFENILQKSKHPHPLIYLRGFQSRDFSSILDFLYFGEANIYQEDLDPFLAIAEEIKLKGLTGQTSTKVTEEEHKAAMMIKDFLLTSTTGKRESTTPDTNALGNPSKGLEVQDQPLTDLQALDEEVKSMMEKGNKMLPNGKQTNGTIMRKTSLICKVCGKEGFGHQIRDRIEANHLEGLSIPCEYCGRSFSSRSSLGCHKRKYCVVATRT